LAVVSVTVARARGAAVLASITEPLTVAPAEPDGAGCCAGALDAVETATAPTAAATIE
jgi:hypothetical protein